MTRPHVPSGPATTTHPVLPLRAVGAPASQTRPRSPGRGDRPLEGPVEEALLDVDLDLREGLVTVRGVVDARTVRSVVDGIECAVRAGRCPARVDLTGAEVLLVAALRFLADAVARADRAGVEVVLVAGPGTLARRAIVVLRDLLGDERDRLPLVDAPVAREAPLLRVVRTAEAQVGSGNAAGSSRRWTTASAVSPSDLPLSSANRRSRS